MRRSLALVVMLLGACGEDPPPPPPPEPPPPPPRPAIAAPRQIATPSSFDLVLAGRGAVLIAGAPFRAGGTITAIPLDPIGRIAPLGERLVSSVHEGVIGAEPIEISAAAAAGRLGIAWVERAGIRAQVRATHGRADLSGFAPPRDVSDTEGGEVGERGRLAVAAAQDGTLTLLARGTQTPCEGASEDRACSSFSIERLGSSEGEPVRRGIGMVVPAPCPVAVSGYIVDGVTSYYGVCAIDQEGVPATTVYAIQTEPEYAHAEAVLSGCDRTRLGRAPEGALLVTRCEGTPRGLAIREAGRQMAPVETMAQQATCEGGRPVLSLTATGPTLRLGEPASDIEAWLPSAMVPSRHARAVWTGEALLLAWAQGGEVFLWRYACENGQLVRTDGLG